MALENNEKWNILHKNPKYWPQYPSERVVQWAFRELKTGDKVLDHGCGTGRHSIFLKENNFDVEGCDVSKSGLDTAFFFSNQKKLSIMYKLYEGVELPCASDYLDALLSYGVLYYQSKEAISLVVDEFKRVLKSCGKALVVVRSTEDSRAKRKVGRGDDEMKMSFFTRDELLYLFRGFSHVQIDQQRQTYGKEIDDDFVITLRK